MNKIAMMVVAFAAFAFTIPGSAAGGGQELSSGDTMSSGIGIGSDTDWMEWKAKNLASTDAGQVTRFPSSLKSPAVDEGICDTDPYSCFYLSGDSTKQHASTLETQHAFFNWIPGFCKKFPNSGVC
ncbi:MAG: hypothetical protein ISN28_06895 [Ectothiorhodospiraceae bacterium AqS1]|nr:hypothetical protein [Ectothiorhodospiraceae bacterium AqS1]